MINPNLLYEESELAEQIGGAHGPLVAARKAGKVTHIAAHHSHFYLGSDIVDWLAQSGLVKAVAEGVQAAAPKPATPVPQQPKPVQATAPAPAATPSPSAK